MSFWRRGFIVISLLCLIFASPISSTADISHEQEVTKRVQEIYAIRANVLKTEADPSSILSLYDANSKYAKWAYAHENNRINFVRNWALKRGVRFTDIKTEVVIKNLKVQENRAKLTAFETLALTYKYNNKNDSNKFGVGMIHSLELVNKDGKWVIKKEYYIDALGDDTLVYQPQPDDGFANVGVKRLPLSYATNSNKQETGQKRFYNRQQAVAYADRYAGLARGAGNNGKYNRNYYNHNGVGGDCTNFISQCLGDKQGGNIRTDGTWYCRGGSGSSAWVRTTSFAQWLQYSGTAKKIAKGTFRELNQPNDQFKLSAIRTLEPGDLIAYEEKGRIQHFAIITGYDSEGYPVVNAHTTDRFHCPWDMGWDKKTIFHLYKVKD